MSALKKLASQTAVYGLTHSLGRFLNFLLVPLYSELFLPEEYGVITVYYSVVGFAIVILMYGMETAFFNFSREEDHEKVFSTAKLSLIVTTFLFVVIGLIFSQQIANFLEYPDQVGLVKQFVFILAFDALATLPLAMLRYKNRAASFGVIKLINIGLNIGFNLFFLLLVPYLITKEIVFDWYDPDYGIGYVVVSNLLASAITWLLLIPSWRSIGLKFDSDLYKRMLRYAYPLIFVGLAGVVNESLDRILIKKLSPDHVADFNTGVYGAFYKLSIIMTLFVQAFRFGAEPFFFEQAKDKDPKPVYARVMTYFVIITSLIFLCTTVLLEQIAPIVIRGEKYYDHPDALTLVPILLLANLCLGILFNLNIWYKLNNKTKLGMYISIAGAVLTVILNFALIPRIGILGSAITTLIVYAGMMCGSYFLGRKHYPIPYDLKRISFYLLFAIGLFMAHKYLVDSVGDHIQIGAAITAIILYTAVAFGIERPLKKL